jgi:hypothetical protein
MIYTPRMKGFMVASDALDDQASRDFAGKRLRRAVTAQGEKAGRKSTGGKK